MASRIHCVLALVLGVFPSAGFPQPESLPAHDSRRLLEALRAAQSGQGHESATLIASLTEISESYAAQGEHALAAAALDQAIQLARAAYGLYTLEQAPLLQKRLESEQALGNFAIVRALEEELFALAERYPDDLSTVAIHRNIAARRMDLLDRFLSGKTPAEIYGEAVFSFQRSELIQKLVSEAQIHYADAAAVILRNGLHSSAELRELEMEIIRSSDLFRQHHEQMESEFSGVIRNVSRRDYGIGRELDQWWSYPVEALRRRMNELWDLASPDAAQNADARRVRVNQAGTRFSLGREGYGRLIAYDDEVLRSTGDGSVRLRRLETHLELADWDLLYSANSSALTNYGNVYGVLESTPNSGPLIATVFAPPIPIVLPTFLPNPLETPVSSRYIEVAFEITKYGKSRRIEIFDTTPDVSDAEKTALVTLIKTSRFRPRVSDGELARAAPVVVRYYLDD